MKIKTNPDLIEKHASEHLRHFVADDVGDAALAIWHVQSIHTPMMTTPVAVMFRMLSEDQV